MVTNADTAWNRVCLYHEILGYLAKLPDASASWRTDSSERVRTRWLHDFRRPDWGYVFMYINLDWREHFQEGIEILIAEIKRYDEMRGKALEMES